jgi:pimeloyl-ACP methyl ester carboxylesterase
MIYRIAEYRLDLGAHRLSRAGRDIHVEPQVCDLIALLAARAPDMVGYEDLVAEIWQGRIVSDATIAARISAARTALGDDGKQQAVIRTHMRRGIQLVVPVVPERGGAVPDAPDPAPDPARDAQGQTLRYARSADGTGIAYAEVGEGPALLRGGHWMSHLEQDWTSPVFGPLLDRLAQHRRLIRYDPRGTGLSERSLNGAGLEQLVDDMEAVADSAGLDRFAIYALSQSVPVALAFAARHPDRVSRMILSNGFVQGELARGEIDRTDALVAMIRAGWGIPGSGFMQAVATVFMPRSTRQELESLVQTQLASATPDVAADLRRMIAGIDVTGILDKVVCPVLVSHATGDAVQSPEQSKIIAAQVREARLCFWDTPNHVVPPNDPVWEACLQAFERFLDEEGGGV